METTVVTVLGNSLCQSSLEKFQTEYSSNNKKITGITKKQENIAHSKEQEKLAENIHEEAQPADLLYKGIKTTVLGEAR